VPDGIVMTTTIRTTRSRLRRAGDCAEQSLTVDCVLTVPITQAYNCVNVHHQKVLRPVVFVGWLVRSFINIRPLSRSRLSTYLNHVIAVARLDLSVPQHYFSVCNSSHCDHSWPGGDCALIRVFFFLVPCIWYNTFLSPYIIFT